MTCALNQIASLAVTPPNCVSGMIVATVYCGNNWFRQKEFFAGAAKMTGQQREEEYNKIKKDYTKVIEEANEKIHIADECYG